VIKEKGEALCQKLEESTAKSLKRML